MFSQQNEEFRAAKQYFDYQKMRLDQEFRKAYAIETDEKREFIKKDFTEFMQKLDSIENSAYLYALIKVKNREDLSAVAQSRNAAVNQLNPLKNNIDRQAEYPGGFMAMRNQIAELFYQKALISAGNTFATQVVFEVDREGYITNVLAEGPFSGFNKQAMIAMYLLPEKFIPARLDGKAIPYRFRFPLSLDLN